VAKKFFPTPRKTSQGVQPFKGVMEGLPLTMEGVCQIYQLIHFLGRTTDHLRVEGLFRKHGKDDGCKNIPRAFILYAALNFLK
jgi:hypothetical protein